MTGMDFNAEIRSGQVHICQQEFFSISLDRRWFLQIINHNNFTAMKEESRLVEIIREVRSIGCNSSRIESN
jgi:hypothetical protein